MMITSSQHAAFTGATLGVPMEAFQFTILAILFSGLYLWAAWVMFTQWRAWSQGLIPVYTLLTRSTRAALVTLFVGFLLI
jgi:integrating conjugative element protein (TIGR03758 family)